MDFIKQPFVKGEKNYIGWLKLAIIPVILIGLLLVLIPIRKNLSNRYLDAGDKLLGERKYISAQVAYDKSLYLNSNNESARNHRELARRSETDLEELGKYYGEVKDTENLRKISWAKAIPSEEIEAVKLSKEFIEKDEYQLAIVSAATATEMDPLYRDAWLYLGISNMKAAQMLELSPESKKSYLANAKLAFEKVKEIDPEYEEVGNLFSQLEKITI